MLGCTGSLSTRGIWLLCADVTQTRRPASFGVRPALFSFRYQIAARWTVCSRIDRTPVLPRSARQSHGLAETQNSQSYCQLRGDPLENRGPDRRNRGGINLVQTAQNGDASPACDSTSRESTAPAEALWVGGALSGWLSNIAYCGSRGCGEQFHARLRSNYAIRLSGKNWLCSATRA